MPSENNLTVRDYFDRVLGARPRHKHAISSTRTRSSRNNRFHQILSSRQRSDSNKPGKKPRGLKVSDYLARPVRAKYQLKPHQARAPIAKSTTDTSPISLKPVIAKPETLIPEPAISFQAAKNKVSSLHTAGLTSSHQQAGVGERQMIETSILKAARKYDLPVNLIKSVIRAESNFQVKAVSHAGAQGLMQLMPATAKALGVSNPFNIEENIDGGSRYLRKMLDSFGGNLKLALAAYNAGPEAVIRYGGRVPPYRETQQYVKRVLRFAS